MRLFFALPLPSHVQAELATCQKIWSKTFTNVKWVKEENIHLTLKFLGEVSANQLKQVAAAARPALAGYHPFTIRVNRAGVFPHLQRARILWVGLEDHNNMLTKLQRDLEKHLASLGFPYDTRSFTPHLTLGRLRQPTRIKLPVLPVDNLVIPVSNVVLYESILNPQGPVYRQLLRFELQ